MTLPSPNISIITPTYNRRHLLPRVWESLNSQTETGFQWIVVDDGSTDGTIDFIHGLADDRITYIHQTNQGCNAARQRGEEEIRAEHVIFLDSDDELYAPDTLEMMLKTIRATPDDIGVVGFAVITPEGGGGHSRFAEDEMILGYEDLICGCKVRGEAFRIFKRSALAVAPWWTEGLGLLSLRYFEIARHYKYYFINKPALLYHMNHGGNLTSAESTIRRAHSMAEGHMKAIGLHRDGWLAACPKVLGMQLFHAAMYCAIDGQTSRAFKLSLDSLRHQGPTAKNLVLLLSLLLPTPIRRKVFIWRSQMNGRD